MLNITGLTASYGDVVAIKHLDVTVEKGEIVCVLGPSGCGKSTLLRVVAGLENPVTGVVSWDGQDLDGVAVHRRGFGLMFQDYALFPHRTVATNVAFGLQMQRQSKAAIAERVESVLGLVGLDGYGDRTIGQLSGGQQQRVALARAIAPEPRLLMFDEPLGALDRNMRERLVIELHDILTTLGTTALYVTHDQEEAFALADRVLLMREGVVEQIGTPAELWARPRTRFAAEFLGFRNLASVAEATAVGWPVPESAADAVVYRPDGFVVDDNGPFHGTVVSRTYRGDHFLVRLAIPDSKAELHVVVRWQPVPELGQQLRLSIEPDAIISVAD
jgi:thiamine transport system ATP-binding protein